MPFQKGNILGRTNKGCPPNSGSFKKGHVGYKGMLGKKLSLEHKLAVGLAHKGKPLSEEHKGKIADSNTGRVMSIETCLKISFAQRGPLGNNWKGGSRERQHSDWRYKEWRTAVFVRDGYACVLGGKEHGSKLNADHIKSWSEYPELRYVISNGRTLCIPCHKETDSYGLKQYHAKRKLQMLSLPSLA